MHNLCRDLLAKALLRAGREKRAAEEKLHFLRKRYAEGERMALDIFARVQYDGNKSGSARALL